MNRTLSPLVRPWILVSCPSPNSRVALAVSGGCEGGAIGLVGGGEGAHDETSEIGEGASGPWNIGGDVAGGGANGEAVNDEAVLYPLVLDLKRSISNSLFQ